MIPHHLAYPRGRRGVNWDVFHPACTPVVEIFSFHGLSEHDRGPHPMVRGSPGGRQTANTVRVALNRGLKFGFVASTDNHAGFPGAWGEGLMGVHADSLSRQDILAAVRARRTFALTGDRIRVQATLNGRPMGADVDPAGEYEFAADIDALDEVEIAELIVDGEVRERFWPRKPCAGALDAPVLLRYEWGWGPWGELALDRVCDWEQTLCVHAGKLLRVDKCLGGGPFDEERRHRIVQLAGDRISIASYTSRRGAFHDVATHSIVVQVQGDTQTRIGLSLQRPAVMESSVTLGELMQGSANFHSGPYGAESFQLHRAVAQTEHRMQVTATLKAGDVRSYAYLRVRQMNGQVAWTSPFFIREAQG